MGFFAAAASALITYFANGYFAPRIAIVMTIVTIGGNLSLMQGQIVWAVIAALLSFYMDSAMQALS